MKKTYVTPYNRLVFAKDNIRFENGVYSTTSEREQTIIENSEKYDRKIFLLTDKESDVVSGEPGAVEAIVVDEDADQKPKTEKGTAVCDVCGKKFKSERALRSHKIVHRNE